ncbi:MULTISPECIES: Hpt domain-containing protein [unclassified Arthrobacter]|uniref:Hpt domain-containing protein n=1 Tax=unclassified Arthrobacter TaxID=235627 RepID=UPI00339AED1F
MPERVRTLLHFDRIRELADQLDSPTETLKFLEIYLQMLPGRLERILRGIREGDADASHDAVLSLKVASSMTGALSAEACCLELETLVRDRRFKLATVSSRRLLSEVTALYQAAPALLLEAKRDLHGIAADRTGLMADPLGPGSFRYSQLCQSDVAGEGRPPAALHTGGIGPVHVWGQFGLPRLDFLEPWGKLPSAVVAVDNHYGIVPGCG